MLCYCLTNIKVKGNEYENNFHYYNLLMNIQRKKVNCDIKNKRE